MKDLIIIGGSPGSGKTTISKLLAKEINSFVFDFGILREVHLDDTWSNQSKKEEQMSFENLVFIMKNYINNGYKNVILNDLQDFRILEVPKVFAEFDYVIISLFVKEDDELRKRIEGPRDSGYQDVKSATEWNRKVIERSTVKNEHKLDNSHREPKKTVKKILRLLDK